MGRISHESAIKHVTGESVYIEDIAVNGKMLYGRVVYSRFAHALITKIDITEALKTEGIHCILQAKDIPGVNQMGPVVHDEPCLALEEVTFIGQAIVLIAANTPENALEAEKRIIIEYKELDTILDIETAIARNNLIGTLGNIVRGDAGEALRTSPNVISGTLKTGAQEHWYLETQSALAVPGEGREMMVHASSQNPAETQAVVAEVLGIPRNEVEVEVRRLGGGFGGKETQGNHVAAWAALLAWHSRRPVKIHLFRDDDQIMTGKRHRFQSNYKIGFDNEGKILGYIVEMDADGGSSTDLSLAILSRAMLHAENAYFIPNISISGKAWKTNLPSNTAFRGFGGPQGMAVIENAVDRIARYLKKDPAHVRRINFYQQDQKNITPYGEEIKNNQLQEIYDRLITSSSYFERREEINKFNRNNRFLKKGLALTPVKFGISFTTSFLNQAGALVNIYTDGTILVNHGGTEMGQGLHTKILQVAAHELGLTHDRIKVNATNTSKIPNTSATAASSGSDMNGMAVKNAIDILKSRLTEVAIEELDKHFHGIKHAEEDLFYENNFLCDKKNTDHKVPFEKIVQAAYLKRISLSANGYYKTPGVFFDKDKGQGNPFYYYVFGMSVSEVIIDTLTGQHQLLRTDILQGVGDSINEDIDKGQIEGGFIQGVGWCTTEEIKWGNDGRLLMDSPDKYKIPTIKDIPSEFKVDILENSPHQGTILKSKAVGEPPFMLAFSVWLAIKDAISAVDDHKMEPEFSLPATYELILFSSEKLKEK